MHDRPVPTALEPAAAPALSDPPGPLTWRDLPFPAAHASNSPPKPNFPTLADLLAAAPTHRTLAPAADPITAATRTSGLFLLATPDGGVNPAVEIVTRTIAARERILILTAAPSTADQLVCRLVVHEPVRLLAPDEMLVQLPSGSAACTLNARAQTHVAAIRCTIQNRLTELETHRNAIQIAQNVAAQPRPDPTRAAARLEELAHKRTRLPELIAQETDTPFAQARKAHADRLAALLAAADQAVAEAEAKLIARRAEAHRVRERLANAAANVSVVKPAGLFGAVRKLMHWDDPPREPHLDEPLEPLDQAVTTSEADLFHAQTTRDHLVAVASAEAAAHVAAELATRQAELDGQVAAVEAECLAAHDQISELVAACRRVGFGHVAEPEELAARLAQAEADQAATEALLAHANPATLAPRCLDAARLVIGPTGAILASPTLTAAPFDRVILIDTEAMTHLEPLLAPGTHAWTLLGNPAGESEFAQLFAAYHQPAWERTAHGWVARLAPTLPTDQRNTWREPLADHPEVELVFAPGPVLAEVRFPAGWSLAEAKTRLAHELGMTSLGPVCEPTWHADPDTIHAVWPGDAEPSWIDLGDGVEEGLCGDRTAAVRFACAEGWTPESAQNWLTENLLPAARTATLSESLAAAR